MRKAKDGTIALLFVDASHFVMGCDYLGYYYGVVRRLVRTFSGRKRYNVLGALDFISKKMTTIANETYITSIEICELISKIAMEYSGIPVFLVLDNARYQKCKIVTELAAQLNVSLVYIPPYSPNLNLIERLWKHVKSKLRVKYYDNFDEFMAKIDAIIESTDKSNKVAIDKLIGEKVQFFHDDDFDNVVNMPSMNPIAKLYNKVA